jgi:hypothetical protein
MCIHLFGTSVCIQSALALRRLALRNFAHTNFCNEAHTLRLARHPNANSLIRNLTNKIKHVLTKTQTTSPSQSLKPGKVHESVRLTLCFGVRLVKHFAACFSPFFYFYSKFHNIFQLFCCFVSANKIVFYFFGHFSVVREHNLQL